MLTERAGPLVSIIIPTFNRLAFLRAAIDSARHQSFTDLEIIVQDNASAEDPTPMVAALADARIRTIRNATNIGQTANIVTACARAAGKYIAILGDDDLFQPEFLARLVPPLEHDPDIVVSFCAHDFIDQHGQLDVARTEACNRRFRDGLAEGVHGPFVDIAMIRRSICVVSAAVFRRDAIDWLSVPTDLPYMSDVYVNYLAARTGKRCYYIPQSLAQRRHLDQSASVEATASIAATETIARAALASWDTFFRDSAVADGRRYFAMKRADNAIRILLCDLWLRGWRTMLREFSGFLRQGIIGPRALLYHFRYGLH
jgi:glycosyltransferase involved in cell wall biosynthesis